MSSKSAVKLVAPDNDQSSLYRWVAILTGSKNALKGVGFFLGGLLLTLIGFQAALLILAAMTLIALVLTSRLMHGQLGTPDKTAKFKQMFSNNRAVNVLAAARIFLFASRDVWFVVGLPFFLYTVVGWTLLAGRHAPRRLGDRLRWRSGRSPRASSAAGPAVPAASPTAGPRSGLRSDWLLCPPRWPSRSMRTSTRRSRSSPA